MAQYGWTKIEQAEVYTRGGDRAHLGVRASEIVEGQIDNNFAHTSESGMGKRPISSEKSIA